MTRLTSLALVTIGAFIGLTGHPLSGSTIAAVLLIVAGGALGIRTVGGRR